ncbi:membrane protein [Pseudorhizobium endolithicum]|uniref:Membrane protein n=1 Tax=Pseudorhizobium endolithicum TaxID=1191678 RepID=A0ABM8PEJ6_9HYPH|nr:tetratricopeptide repeat protein [Pseudorhizobium endolithicum]CAD7024681.1 membrane protein [Pseudorhizobium endolithicum]
MAHDNDSFIREVNEELRSDQFRTAWSRYGKIAIGAAVVIVLATAGYRGYEYWQEHNASQSGDRFLAALNLASEGKHDEALAAFQALEADGSGAYPVLAQMRAAAVLAERDDVAGAVQAFKAVAAEGSAPEAMRDVARLRAAWLLIDTGSYEEVSAEAEVLTGGNHALRNSAREALGLAAYKGDDMARAKEWFQAIADDATAPRNVASRAQIMLDNIAASGKAP